MFPILKKQATVNLLSIFNRLNCILVILDYLDKTSEISLKQSSKKFNNAVSSIRQKKFCNKVVLDNHNASSHTTYPIFTHCNNVLMPKNLIQYLANKTVQFIENEYLLKKTLLKANNSPNNIDTQTYNFINVDDTQNPFNLFISHVYKKRFDFKYHVQFMHEKVGYGVVTDCVIPQDMYLFIYAGEMVSTKEALFRENNRILSKTRNYLLTIKETIPENNLPESELMVVEDYDKIKTLTTNIDATYIGNITRFINHSCTPNLDVSMIRLSNQDIFAIPVFKSNRIITPDEELTFHYNYFSNSTLNTTLNSMNNSTMKRIRCYCNSKNCNGFLPYNTD